ncbi:complex I NDUFA9 subunit family protein [Desulfolucanica intricata]|uniref:complex I NDUFA9 subunit family protein n=1 Tax=Desulfolucanica intricata TaxID=1285191 RepID=UPI00082EE626|nr:complex I NDUFA9 subunit family protein [Desulfolucanica intricata]
MILITGAGGFVGHHLVKALVNQGFNVRCLVRSPDAAVNLLPEPVEITLGNVNDFNSLQEACNGVSVVIHLVAIIREKGEDTFNKINIEGTKNLVEAAENNGVNQFLHLSALGANNDPNFKYIFSKWQGEQFVINSNLNWTIFRPSVIYGEGFGFLNRMSQAIQMSPPPLVPVPGKGKALFQPIAVSDLINCIIKTINNNSTSKKIIEIGGPEHLSYKEILDILLSHLGHRRIKVSIPLPILSLVVPIMNRILKDPPVTPVELKQLKLDNITELDSVERIFGFKPIPFREGIKYIPKLKPTA